MLVACTLQRIIDASKDTTRGANIMSTSLSFKLVSTAAALLLASVTVANAAAEKVCEDYAHAAIVQVRLGLNSQRCAANMGGTRWSPEWRVHYDWCRGASYEQIGGERDARTGYLRSCR
jgi:hypothetical protein